MGGFLSKAAILGVGVFSLLSLSGRASIGNAKLLWKRGPSHKDDPVKTWSFLFWTQNLTNLLTTSAKTSGDNTSRASLA